jgi:hypothetical protein
MCKAIWTLCSLAIFVGGCFGYGPQGVAWKSQTVIVRVPVRLPNPHTDTPLMDVEGRNVDQYGFAADIQEILSWSKIGKYDFDFWAGETMVIYLQGPSADRISDAILPILRGRHYTRTISIKRRYGPKGSRESTIYVKPR